METTSEMTGHQIISLFPLGVVLLPHMEMPLHVFEERYKVMINECLEQKRDQFLGVRSKGFRLNNGAYHIVRIQNKYSDFLPYASTTPPEASSC